LSIYSSSEFDVFITKSVAFRTRLSAEIKMRKQARAEYKYIKERKGSRLVRLGIQGEPKGKKKKRGHIKWPDNIRDWTEG
jgi:hypothetical protein